MEKSLDIRVVDRVGLVTRGFYRTVVEPRSLENRAVVGAPLYMNEIWTKIQQK